MSARTKKLDLVGVAEIAALLGITRQRVNQLVAQREDFPEPVAHLSAGRIWRRDDVARWAEHRRSRRP